MAAPILLIDDDEDVGVLTRSILKSAGILNPLIAVLTPDEGLNYLHNPANELPAMVLLDLYFPGQMAGTDILKLIRTNPRTHALCVFVTTVMDEQEQIAMILGANKFMRKPPTLAKLLEAASDCNVQLEVKDKE